MPRKFFKESTYYFKTNANALLLLSIIFIAFFVRVYNIYTVKIPFAKDVMWIWCINLFSFMSLGEGFRHPPLYQIVLIVAERLYFTFGYFVGLFTSVIDFERQRIVDPFSFFMLARFVNIVLGIATIGVIYSIGKKIQDKRTGLIAALFLALSYSHVILSRAINNDILVTLLISISFLFTVDVFFLGNLKSYLKAGFIIGLAIAAKYTGILAIVPFVLAHFLNKGLSKGWCDKKLYFALFFLCLGFLIAYPAVLSESIAFLSNVNYRIQLKWNSHYYQIGNSLLFLKVVCNELGFLLSIFSIGGIIYCLLNFRNKKNLLLISFPLFFYLVIYISRAFEEHWLLPIYPFLFLISSYFIIKLIDKAKFSKKINNLILILLIFIMIFPSAKRILKTEYVFAEKDIKKAVAVWTKMFISGIKVDDLALQAAEGREIWTKVTGSSSLDPKRGYVPYMATYFGPTVTISGKVFFKEHKGKSVIMQIGRGCRYDCEPNIVMAIIKKPGEYAIKVPKNCGWVTVRARVGKDLTEDSHIIVINIKDSDVNGVDLVLP